MSNCLHGVYLGVGCKKCPKPKIREGFSKERTLILATAVAVGTRASVEKEPVNKARMEKDFAALMKMRGRY